MTRSLPTVFVLLGALGAAGCESTPPATRPAEVVTAPAMGASPEMIEPMTPATPSSTPYLFASSVPVTPWTRPRNAGAQLVNA